MAHEESLTMTSKGTVDGKPVTFTYSLQKNAEDGKLTWEGGGESSVEAQLPTAA